MTPSEVVNQKGAHRLTIHIHVLRDVIVPPAAIFKKRVDSTPMAVYELRYPSSLLSA